MDVNQMKRVKELESELTQYKKIIAEQTFQITVLKDIIEKKL
jgi:putative transposase